jgi:hypothetical protein
MEVNMRGFSWLKKGRVALAAVGLATGLAGMTLAAGGASADDHGWRGGHERHFDRGDHWRGDHGRWDHGHYYRGDWGWGYPGYYAPRAYYVPDAYYPPPPAYYYGPAPGLSLGFNFR